MEFNQYQQEAIKFARYKQEYAMLYPALALQEEAGEVAGKIAKLLRDNDGVEPEGFRDAMKKELGDVLWGLSALCLYFELSLEDVAIANITKLAARKENNTLHGSGDDR